MKRLGNEGGFSFLEVVLALGIIMILVSALVPVISTQIEDAKIARAKDDVALIASAICQFNADTDEWPIWYKGTACTNGSDRFNYLVSEDGEMPAGISLGTFGVNHGYDSIDNQLVYNTPGRTGSGNGTSPYPDEASDTTTPWRGPYIHGPNGGNNNAAGRNRAAVSKDPWGNKYIVNAWALDPYRNDCTIGHHYVAVVISAGPNEKIDTDITHTSGMKLRDFKVEGDDIACVIK